MRQTLVNVRQRGYRSVKHFLTRLIEPLLLTFNQRIGWRFCLLISVESLVIASGLVYVMRASFASWQGLFWYLMLSLMVPLLLLQILRRLVPEWMGSIELKYLSIFGVLAVWLSSMAARREIGEIFFVAPTEFPGALAAATFLNVGHWLSLLVALSCFALEVLTLVAIAKPRLARPNAKTASPWLRATAFALVFAVAFAVAKTTRQVLSPPVASVVVARVAWDVDLLPAPASCVPKGETPAGDTQWRVLPTQPYRSDTVAIRSFASLPSKPFWRFSDGEFEKFSSFDVVSVECGVPTSRVATLSKVEADHARKEAHREATKQYWGIEPVGRFELRTPPVKP